MATPVTVETSVGPSAATLRVTGNPRPADSRTNPRSERAKLRERTQHRRERAPNNGPRTTEGHGHESTVRARARCNDPGGAGGGAAVPGRAWGDLARGPGQEGQEPGDGC